MGDSALKPYRVIQIVQISLLVLLSLAVFANTLSNELVWDDLELISENRYIRDCKNIPLFFTARYWNTLHPFPGVYRPVRTASLAVDYAFWGENPVGYRTTNIFLHAVNVVLLFILVAFIDGKWPGGADDQVSPPPKNLSLAFFTALLFAVHPIHTESINLIKNRSDLLALLFFLLSLLSFVKHLEPGARRPRLSLLFAWCCFIPAVLSKEMAVTLPGVLALYAFCFLPGSKRKKALIRLAPYGVVIVVYFWLTATFILPAEPLPTGSTAPDGFFQLALTVIKTSGVYFRMLLAPFPLTLDHAFTLPETILISDVLTALVALLMSLTVAVRMYRRAPVVSFAIGWTLLTLVPALNLVYLASRPIAEQRLYIPSFGFCLLSAYAIERLGHIRSQASHLQKGRAGWVLAVALISLYAVVTVNRNFDWQDPVVLYAKALAANPESTGMQNNYAIALYDSGKYEQAAVHFQSALRLEPDGADIHFNLGCLYFESGRNGEAVKHYREALRLAPDYYKIHNNLGVVLHRMGRLNEARSHFERAMALKPDQANAFGNMGDLLADMECLEEAAGYYFAALGLQPDSLIVARRLGKVLLAMGEMDKAIQVYEDALVYCPDDERLHYALAEALAAKRRLARPDHFEKKPCNNAE